MEISWSTFALEIVNFLVLVWILTRFLYRPVREVLDRRRAGIERALAESRATAEEAQALKHRFEDRLAAWEKEKAAAREAFEAELGAERERRMHALDHALADERARRRAQDEHRQQTLCDEAEHRAIGHARHFTATLLGRLAGPAMDARLVDLFVDDLARLPEAELAGLRAAAADPEVRAAVVSAARLDDGQRQRIAEALATRLGRALPVDFSENAELVAGLRVSLGPWQLRASLADELAFFANADHAA